MASAQEGAVRLTETARARLQAANFGYLATIMADGTPQVSPVWVDVRGEHILVNTAKGRLKERNLHRDPRLGLSVTDKDNPYDKVDVRGRVVEWIDGDEAEAHIDAMAQKYLGQERYPFRGPGERRVDAVIEATRLSENEAA
jgi:PPOX class probable F420-dependent enzyme